MENLKASLTGQLTALSERMTTLIGSGAMATQEGQAEHAALLASQGALFTQLATLNQPPVPIKTQIQQPVASPRGQFTHSVLGMGVYILVNATLGLGGLGTWLDLGCCLIARALSYGNLSRSQSGWRRRRGESRPTSHHRRWLLRQMRSGGALCEGGLTSSQQRLN